MPEVYPGRDVVALRSSRLTAPLNDDQPAPTPRASSADAVVGINFKSPATSSTARLCSVGASGSGCSTGTLYASGFGYNAAMQVTGFKYGNPVYASFGFSPDRLQMTCLDYSTTNRNGNCVHDGTTKFGLGYSYGTAGSNNGQISGITDSVDNGRSATYTYDSLNRLSTAVTVGSAGYAKWGLSWNYDRYGNITAENQTFDTPPHFSLSVSASTNRITTSPYAYDNAGNLTNDGNNTLLYDAENHVVSASNGGTSGTYTYDGNGLRVQKISAGTTTVTIYSGRVDIAEYQNGAAPSSPVNEYVNLGTQKILIFNAGTTTYYHNDHLSLRLRTNSSGTVLDQRGTYPYGESWYSPSGAPWMFTSYFRDTESGNDYAMARSYVSRINRFSSPDPVGGSIADPQSLNAYPYTRNNPINLSDPTGLFALSGPDPTDPGPISPFPPWFEAGLGNWTKCINFGDDDFGMPDFECSGIGNDFRNFSRGTGARGDSKKSHFIDRYAGLADCVKQFYGIELKNFTVAKPGSNGNFNGVLKDGHQVSIETDATTYSQFMLSLMNLDFSFKTSGLTQSINPYLNYVANNLPGEEWYGEEQIHELGHSLDLILKGSSNEKSAEDLFKCVLPLMR